MTRAGTTSLAEQKLYDMKLFIVPIAWTHDQYDNAKYYVQKHKDLLIDQRDPKFEEHLVKAFRQNVGYHKTDTHKDIPSLIEAAKDQIAQAIIEQ
ncbi:hypothetical protein KKG31_02130 [Patescibacteria group bacterium]|nr:hypothetical protein [Patescibacteria group bacterium]MBU1757971.1 hypothetical protein [Patescibacteria group bacterium]